jgi:hypothetical protein
MSSKKRHRGKQRLLVLHVHSKFMTSQDPKKKDFGNDLVFSISTYCPKRRAYRWSLCCHFNEFCNLFVPLLNLLFNFSTLGRGRLATGIVVIVIVKIT